MKVILADTLGFCKGVESAVNLIYSEVNRIGGKNVLMEGPVIHNRILIEDLESKGVQILNNESDIKDKSVVIRAHGVTPALETSLIKKGARIVDGTCAIVKASQNKIKKYVSEGYYVVITGDQGHPEVIGLIGQAPESIVVISSVEDLEGIILPEKTLLVSQTTFSKPEFYKIESEIKKICPTLKSICTICGATKIRQEAVKKLAREVDAIVIVGGLTSSNTKRLKRVAEEYVPAWLVETYRDIPEEVKKYEVVGVTAGASTPSNIIEEVVDALRLLN